MKHIPLRVVEATPDGSAAMTYAETIRVVIRQPLDTARGVDIEEMRRGIRILDALDAAASARSDTLDLEDADYDHLAAKVKAMVWGMVDRHLMEFIDTVLADSSPTPPAALPVPGNGLVIEEVLMGPRG